MLTVPPVFVGRSDESMSSPFGKPPQSATLNSNRSTSVHWCLLPKVGRSGRGAPISETQSTLLARRLGSRVVRFHTAARNDGIEHRAACRCSFAARALLWRLHNGKCMHSGCPPIDRFSGFSVFWGRIPMQWTTTLRGCLFTGLHCEAPRNDGRLEQCNERPLEDLMNQKSQHPPCRKRS